MDAYSVFCVYMNVMLGGALLVGVVAVVAVLWDAWTS